MKIAILFVALLFGQIYFWDLIGWNPVGPLLSLMEALPPPETLPLTQALIGFVSDPTVESFLSVINDATMEDMIPLIAHWVLLMLVAIMFFAIPLLGIGLAEFFTKKKAPRSAP